MEFYEIAKTIFYKNNLDCDIDMGICLGLSGIFKKRAENLPYLKKILPFLFWIDPKHFYYLLFFHIPSS